MKLNIKALALTAGLFWGIGIFVMTWWLIMFGHRGVTILFTHMYPGYSVTPLGSLIGIPWAFVDGTIIGAIFAWLYNRFVPK